MRRVLSNLGLVALFACGSAEDTPPGTPPSTPGPTPTPAPVEVETRLGVMTFNIANGAGDAFRTPEIRKKQGALVARSGPDVVGMQEVDVNAVRSGDVDTAAAVAVEIAPGFDACTFDIGAAPHVRGDGTRVARCTAGAIVFGAGFRADDPFAAASDGTPSGIIDDDTSIDPASVDRGADAFYGNAFVVRAPWSLVGSYTVTLAVTPDDPGAPASLVERLSRAELDAETLASLAAHNEAARHARGVEPRSVLVVRVGRESSPTFSVLTTHLEAGDEAPLRRAQLAGVIAVARAERIHSANRVVVMGDFNMPAFDVEPGLGMAGFVRAAPPNVEGDLDQVWVDATLALDGVERVLTEGASDHGAAPSAVVRSTSTAP